MEAELRPKMKSSERIGSDTQSGLLSFYAGKQIKMWTILISNTKCVSLGTAVSRYERASPRLTHEGSSPCWNEASVISSLPLHSRSECQWKCASEPMTQALGGRGTVCLNSWQVPAMSTISVWHRRVWHAIRGWAWAVWVTATHLWQCVRAERVV